VKQFPAFGCMAILLVALAASLSPLPGYADEGMWTFNDFPAPRMRAAYGWAPDAAWLRHVRLGSLRISQGCSASLVSRDGLVMTNEHCIRECLGALSDATQDLVSDGYYAKTPEEERRCPDLEADQLVDIRDVTGEIAAATAGKSNASFDQAERQAKARLESACGTSAAVRCEVVTLYQGGSYNLYKYNRFQDIRLAFVTELSSAAFGGDLDNFNFPRYDLDVAFLRIYMNGRPRRTADFLTLSMAPIAEGDVALTSGNPGTTERDQTVAQLQLQRDFVQPFLIATESELRGLLGEFGRRGPDQLRLSTPLLTEIENELKFFKGRQSALIDGPLITDKARAEQDLRRRVAADPRLASVGDAWDAIATAVARQRRIGIRNTLLERYPQNFSDLLSFAVKLNRYAAESLKASGDRLPEYSDARLEAVKQQIVSPLPIHAELEEVQLAWWLTKLREHLGADDADVKVLLDGESPDTLAAALITSKLVDAALRARLFEGGSRAIEAYHDPLLDFARLLDGPARRVRRDYEINIRAVITENAAKIARARFALDGRSRSPDATFSPRLSYGRVKGYEERGRYISPTTTFEGAYARATGRDPFALPPSWLRARGSIAASTTLNFVASTDVTGGNSGSPVLGRDGQIIGLVFDGNEYSLGGEFGYDGALNRTIAVDVAGIRQALAVIYHADRLTLELFH
jgi:hypothetical protein